jgi:hypothetical protein
VWLIANSGYEFTCGDAAFAVLPRSFRLLRNPFA